MGPGVVDHAKRSRAKTVPGTRSTHCFVFSKSSKVMEKREYSCFCASCVDGEGECHNTSHVKPLSKFDLNKVVCEESAALAEELDMHDDVDGEEGGSMRSLIASLRGPTTPASGPEDMLCNFIVEKDPQDDYGQYDYYVCLVVKPLAPMQNQCVDAYGQRRSAGEPVLVSNYYDLIEGSTSAEPLYQINPRVAYIRPGAVRFTHFAMLPHATRRNTYILHRDVHAAALAALHSYKV